MYELAKVEDSAGNVSGARRWLQKLHATTRRNIPGGVYLLVVYLRTGEPQKAVEVAKNLEAIASRDLNVLAAAGRAYLAVGDEKPAQEVFTRMGDYAELDPRWQYDIAQYQLRANNPQGAAHSLGKALAAKPDFLQAEEALAAMDLRRRQVDAAVARAKSMIGRYPQKSVGYRLLGDAASSRGDGQEAMTQYRNRA